MQRIRGGDHHQVIRPLHETLPGRLQGPSGSRLAARGRSAPGAGRREPAGPPRAELGDHPGVIGPPAGADDPYPDGLHGPPPGRGADL